MNNPIGIISMQHQRPFTAAEDVVMLPVRLAVNPTPGKSKAQTNRADFIAVSSPLLCRNSTRLGC